MTGLRRALIALGAAGAVLLALAVALQLTSDHVEEPVLNAVGGGLVMSTYIAVGLVAWWRRPHNRFGALMAAVGFAYAVGALTAADASLPATVGVVFGAVYLAVAAHMVLAFPTGRLATPGQRRLVAATYALVVLAPLIAALVTEDTGPWREPGLPPNAFAVADAPAVADLVDAVASALGALATVAIAALLVRRWRTASPLGRRALAPVLLTGIVMVGFLSLALAVKVAGAGDGLEHTLGALSEAAFALLPLAFLAGLARSRLWRAGAVGELVAALDEAPGRGRLRDVLADALGDPGLELAFWLPDRGRYVDARGEAVELPGPGAPRVATEVRREGERVGALLHDPSLCDEPELVRAAGATAAIALERERLDAELRARVAELRESRQRLVEATLAERRRLERDLHDGAQQRLVALSLQLGLLGAALDRGPGGTEAARGLVDGARAEARAALEDLRELARGIHPAALSDHGLRAALEGLAARAPVPVEVGAVPAERLPAPVEAAAYFVVAESLTNVAKYARAGSARVDVVRRGDVTRVEVRDDGVGGADPAQGTGLRGLADRVAALDGRLEVHSPPGAGTVVRAELPCSGAPELARPAARVAHAASGAEASRR